MSYIFAHGLGQSSSSWEKTVDELYINAEIECPNLFELCAGGLNYNNLYKAFSEYCNMHSDSLDLCGISLGGMLALHYTIDHPYKVHSLVLIGTQYRIPNHLMAFQNIIFRLMPQKSFDKIGISKQELISLTKSMMNLDFEEDLGKVACPVLIICGEKDKVNMKAARQLQNKLSGSKLKMIDSAGHEVNIDNPKLLGKELKDFLSIG